MLDIVRLIVRLFERRIQQVNRFEPLRFEFDFVELRGNDVTFAVAPKHLHGVGRERDVAWIARFQRSLEDDNGMREVLVAFALNDVVLRVVSEDLLEVRVLPMAILKLF